MNPRDFHKPCSGDQCLICGGLPSVVGVFVPERPEDFGGVRGRIRFIRYCLCATCGQKKHAQDRAEKIILSELAGGAIHE